MATLADSFLDDLDDLGDNEDDEEVPNTDGAGARRGRRACGERLIGICHKEMGAVDSGGDGEDAGSIYCGCRVELSVVSDDELDDGVVVAVDDIEI